jgi:hypothetical protein
MRNAVDRYTVPGPAIHRRQSITVSWDRWETLGQAGPSPASRPPTAAPYRLLAQLDAQAQAPWHSRNLH